MRVAHELDGLRSVFDATRGGASPDWTAACAAVTAAAGVSGATLALLAEGGSVVLLGASDDRMTAIGDAELTAGEGPSFDAFDRRAPVLVADLADGPLVRWIGLDAPMAGAHLAAIFAFPLQVGRARLGAMVLARERPGALVGPPLSRALASADIVTDELLRMQAIARVGGVPVQIENRVAGVAELHQAAGMIAGQLDIEVKDALVCLRARAYADQRSVRAVAADVLTRKLRFRTDRPGS
jgi:hypothetical protein